MEIERTAILILNWKHPEETIRCLTHLFREPRLATVVIVDNGSDDNSVDVLRKFLGGHCSVPGSPSVEDGIGVQVGRFKIGDFSIMLVLSDTNRGFTGGMNLAAQVAIRAGAGSLFLLNNDAEIGMSDIIKLRSISKVHKNALVSPLVLDFFDRNKLLFSGYKWPHFLFGFGVCQIRSPLPETWSTGYIEGSAVFLSAAFVDQKFARDGFLFDESYYLYCEDVDLSLSAQKIGFPCLVTSAVRAFHKVSLSSGGKGSVSAYYYITRNRILLAKKWLRTGEFFLYSAYYLITRTVLMAWRGFKGDSKLINKAVLKGLRDGYLGRSGHEG